MKKLIAITLMTAVSTFVLAQSPSDMSDKPSATTPDDRSLTGARNLGLGSDAEHENMLRTSLSVSESATSNARLASSADNSWTSASGVFGSAILSRLTRLTDTDLSYHGGASFYGSDSGLNTQTHQFGIAETLGLRRWTVTLADSLDYEPDGQGGMFGISGVDGADIRNQYLANGSVLTPTTSRLSNTPVVDIGYDLTRKTTINATASYATLDFLNSSLLNTTQRSLGGGINHSYRRNTVGASYTDTMFHYEHQSESMQTHALELNFARRVSAKYSVDGGIGPEVMVSKIGNGSSTDVLASGHFALNWRGARTATSMTYSHGVTNGSGVTPGAKSDQLAANISRTVSRNLSVNGTATYARNAATLTKETFNTIGAMGGVSRQFGRNASMGLNYFYQRQTSTGAFDHLQNHTITFSFTWNFRPVRFK